MTVDHLRYDKNHEEYLRVGRNLLDDLTRSMALSGIGVGHRTIDLPDGTRIIVSSRNGGNDIEIIPPIELPVVPEEKKREEEEEEEEIIGFLAVGAKVIDGPDLDAQVYLYVVEPAADDGDDEDRIVGMYRYPEGYTARVRMTTPLVTNDGEEFDPVSYTDARANPRGVCGYKPKTGDLLNGYKVGILVYEKLEVSNFSSGETIDPVILGGSYAIKVCMDSSCEAEDWEIELRFFIGIDADDEKSILEDRTETVTISWADVEFGDNWARLVTPFGVDADADVKTMLEGYSPPSCFNWEADGNINGPPDGATGPNPHANNYWQGAYLADPDSLTITLEEDYVPDVGYEPGSLMDGSNAYADLPICAECDEEPIISGTLIKLLGPLDLFGWDTNVPDECPDDQGIRYGSWELRTWKDPEFRPWGGLANPTVEPVCASEFFNSSYYLTNPERPVANWDKVIASINSIMLYQSNVSTNEFGGKVVSITQYPYHGNVDTEYMKAISTCGPEGPRGIGPPTYEGCYWWATYTRFVSWFVGDLATWLGAMPPPSDSDLGWTSTNNSDVRYVHFTGALRVLNGYVDGVRTVFASIPLTDPEDFVSTSWDYSDLPPGYKELVRPFYVNQGEE